MTLPKTRVRETFLTLKDRGRYQLITPSNQNFGSMAQSVTIYTFLLKPSESSLSPFPPYTTCT